MQEMITFKSHLSECLSSIRDEKLFAMLRVDVSFINSLIRLSIMNINGNFLKTKEQRLLWRYQNVYLMILSTSPRGKF